MSKKAVWFSESDNDIIDFVKNSKKSFSGSIKDLIRYAIEFKKLNVILDQNGDVCIMTKINSLVPSSSQNSIETEPTKKIDGSNFI